MQKSSFAGYLAKSKDDESQQRFLKRARAQNLDVIVTYADARAEISKRPGLWAAVAELEKARVHGIVTGSLADIALPLSEMSRFITSVQSAGGSLYFLLEELWIAPEQVATFAQLLQHAQAAESAHKSSRIRRALAKRRLAKQPLGAPRYADVEIIADIKRMRASSFSLKQIAETLNQQHIKTARHKSWHPATIARILADHS